MTDIALLEREINSVATNFNDLAKIHGAVNFIKEASFAIQALKQNDYLMKAAYANTESLQFAVLNIASIGLSLNPALKHAYLVPRSSKVTLDISYMGLCQLACESGGIKWVQAQAVYEKDEYIFNGVGKEPTHKFKPFEDRGKVIGFYAMAKTEDEEFLVDQMSLAEVEAIRDRTEAWKAYVNKKIKSCPWSTDFIEMGKKTVIKRAYKLWPKNDKLHRLEKAIDVINMEEGIDFKKETEFPQLTKVQEEEIKTALLTLKREEKAFLSYFSKVVKRDLDSIADLKEPEAETALIHLKQFVQQETKKLEAANENA